MNKHEQNEQEPDNSAKAAKYQHNLILSTD